jgi:hypothetical protein
MVTEQPHDASPPARRANAFSGAPTRGQNRRVTITRRSGFVMRPNFYAQIGVASNYGICYTSRPAYYPGKEEDRVRQAFQPDLAVLSGWKA